MTSLLYTYLAGTCCSPAIVLADPARALGGRCYLPPAPYDRGGDQGKQMQRLATQMALTGRFPHHPEVQSWLIEPPNQKVPVKTPPPLGTAHKQQLRDAGHCSQWDSLYGICKYVTQLLILFPST